MAGVTNKGKFRTLEGYYRGVSSPTNFYIALITSASTPTADTQTFSELTEISTGNGYVGGGIALTPGTADFDVLTEDSTNDRAFIQLSNVMWTASSGTIPSTGTGIKYAILTDDNSTQGDREVLDFWGMTTASTVVGFLVPDGQDFTLIDSEIGLNETS